MTQLKWTLPNTAEQGIPSHSLQRCFSKTEGNKPICMTESSAKSLCVHSKGKEVEGWTTPTSCVALVPCKYGAEREVLRSGLARVCFSWDTAVQESENWWALRWKKRDLCLSQRKGRKYLKGKKGAQILSERDHSDMKNTVHWKKKQKISFLFPAGGYLYNFCKLNYFSSISLKLGTFIACEWKTSLIMCIFHQIISFIS